MKPVLAVALPGSREHVMLLVLEGRTLQAGVARISARPNGNAIQKFIERVTWLDRETCALASAPMLGLDSSTEDLRANLALCRCVASRVIVATLTGCCSALAIMENLASQLLQRGIICDGMASVSPPALHIRDRDVFKHGAGAGVVLRLLDWQDPARTRVSEELPGCESLLNGRCRWKRRIVCRLTFRGLRIYKRIIPLPQRTSLWSEEKATSSRSFRRRPQLLQEI